MSQRFDFAEVYIYCNYYVVQGPTHCSTDVLPVDELGQCKLIMTFEVSEYDFNDGFLCCQFPVSFLVSVTRLDRRSTVCPENFNICSV